MTQTAYLAADGYLEPLLEELGTPEEIYGNLVLMRGDAKPAYWAQNVWYDVQRAPVASIKDAAKQLRAIQRNWSVYSHDFHRRAALIQENLPHISAKPVEFPSPLPKAPLGAWTLIAPDAMLFAAKTASPYIHGEVHFVEDKETPPNRAYLKLWEAFTLIERLPKKGETCVDLGACPGGWSWVLAKTGADVISVDKAPLEPHIAKMKNIAFRKESAFGIKPEVFGEVDWMCCDIACYPERLLRLVNEWLKAGNCKNFICTLKFQGPTDHATAKQFAAIEGSRLLHLSCNKHELTWIKLSD
ncbi:MAG: hypothetical protein EB060_05045 [Proteobacteria bacterium]|nr:hypothetical protein [Pseudomonadota bacterium]